MSNSIEVTTKAGVKIAVNAVVGGNGGGGGVTAHGDLTGLTTGDDHTQYQRSEATYTSSASYTVTDESTVITAGSAVTLPDAEGMAGRIVGVGAAAQTVTVSPAGTDTMFDDPGNPYSLPVGNGITFVAVQIGGNWGWAVYTRNGPAFDMPKWVGESVAAGEVLRMGASAPEWTNDDPGAYDFLSGTGWTDNVPVVIPCKNTSAGTITKGQAVYVTGTVGATSVVEIALADCDDAAKMPAIGLAESTMAVNATGYVVVTGVLSGVDTSGFTINGPLYVSTTAGVLTGTKPTGTTELIQNIGRATRINASTGEVLVLGPGRTNDVPNAIDAGKLTSGTVAIARIPTGTTSTTVALGNDSRFTDARAPQWRRLTFSDTAYDLSSNPSPAVAGSVVLQQTGTLTAARTVTLPAASACPAGSEVIVNAGAGASGTNTVTVQRAGSDTINAATTSVVIGTAWGQRRFVSDGTSAWAYDDGLVRRSQNLSDLASASSARTNLGLAAIATSGSGSDISTGTVAVARLGAQAAPTATPYASNDWVPMWTGWGVGAASLGTGGSASASNNAARYQPVWIGQAVSLVGLGIDVAAANAGASAVVRLGLYSDSSGKPGTVVVDAGTASLGTAVAKELTFSSVSLSPGWYWLAIATQSIDTAGTNPTFRAINTGTSLSSRTSVPSNTALQDAVWTSTSISGAFASSPTVSASTSNVQAFKIWGKFA